MSDSGALQEAINSAQQTGVPVELERRVYSLTEPLHITSDVRIHGNGAQLVAQAPMVAALFVGSPIGALLELERLTVNGAKTATHCMEVLGAGRSVFRDVNFTSALVDQVHVTDEGNNDCMEFRRCLFQHGGKVLTGTATASPGPGSVVTGEGIDFTSLRPFDHICVGGEWLQVAEVLGADKLRCALHPPSIGHAAPVPLTAHVGDGYREEIHNDNNLIVFEDCLFRDNAGSGASFHGLYGPRLVRPRSDFNGAFGFSVGMATESNVIGMSFRDCYIEENGARSFFLGYAGGITVDTLNCPEPQPFLVSNPSFNWGTSCNVQGTGGALRAIGGDSETDIAATRFRTYPRPPVGEGLPSGTIAFNNFKETAEFIGWVQLGREWFGFGAVNL